MDYLVDEELEKILDSFEFEEFGGAYLSHVRQDSTGLRLVFDFKTGLRFDWRLHLVDKHWERLHLQPLDS